MLLNLYWQHQTIVDHFSVLFGSQLCGIVDFNLIVESCNSGKQTAWGYPTKRTVISFMLFIPVQNIIYRISVLMVMIFKDYDKLATYENLSARPKDLC